MLISIAICIILVFAALEALSLTQNLKHLAFRCDVNMDLTEPGEEATLIYRLTNTARWPMMFVSFSLNFNESVEVRESEEWIKRHHTGDFFNRSYTVDTYLPARTAVKGRIRFSLKQRGHHDIGKVYIEVGDFLGLKTKVVSYDITRRVICTAAPCEDEPDIVALGGLMGDISVRRFICEDPSLVLGYREYTGAEPLKSISWTQTAKTGVLTVKKHDFTMDTDVSVIVDIERAEKEVAERCFSLIRTACDWLEEQKIPYALHSNGDLFSTDKGVGRTHCFEIQRRIGISKFIRYRPFSDLVERVSRGNASKGYIIIAPSMDDEITSLVHSLQQRSGTSVCVLTGEEDGDAA
ncbi:MAG: DUF58 domain-containing protein [Clostridia bacterium]|nr:DUF58 domain-containing protein [Clostridia bacterium]